jgi:hypothetical protein
MRICNSISIIHLSIILSGDHNDVEQIRKLPDGKISKLEDLENLEMIKAGIWAEEKGLHQSTKSCIRKFARYHRAAHE